MSTDSSGTGPPVSLGQLVLRAVYGAGRFALWDKSALVWFELTVAGFWRSFAAVAIVAPFYFLVILTPPGEGSAEAAPGIGFVGSLAVYLLSWIVFPVVMIVVARLLSLSRTYVAFIIVHNWSQVIIMAAFLPLALARAVGVAAEQAVAVVGLVLSILFLVYKWFIARHALGAAAGAAVGVTILDVLIDEFLVEAGQLWLATPTVP